MTHITDSVLKKLLLDGGYVAQEDVVMAESQAKKNSSLTEYFLSEGILSKDLIGQAIAEFYKVPYADINSNEPSREQVLTIDGKDAKKFRIVLFKKTDKEVTVATDDPTQKKLSGALKRIFPKLTITIAYALPEDIDSVFIHYRKALGTRFNEIIQSKKQIAPEIIEEIINDALTFRASDIHFEPQETETLIRFRVDGVLQEAGRIPKEYYENILNRIKIISELKIDEHHTPQDGALRVNKDGHQIDMRVSIVPAIDGEKVVIRLLAEYIKSLSFDDLGFSSANQEIIKKAATKPFGMILVSGPTGSGKTTSLYSLLKLRNHPDINITTIEDPVEYKIVGATQIQVRPETGIDFAQGLRSIVRQDPDIILVGEIRDSETAQIATNAALTGHLLFSTFHANDAATTIPRLIDMGVEPFLLASTLELVVSQRLVRKMCEECRSSYTEKVKNLTEVLPQAAQYFEGDTVTLYKSSGCSACGGMGYKGRTAIIELISITPSLKELMLKNPSTQEIWNIAVSEGAQSLFDDGIEKVKQGVTTLEELMRVASPRA